MTSTPSPYRSSIVSARSRRLRTIAAILLTAIVGMGIYGMAVVIPAVRHAVLTRSRLAPQNITPEPVRSNAPKPIDTPVIHRTERNSRILKFDIVFAACYWTLWLGLVVALLLVAWLDLREVSRNYLNQRKALWTSIADEPESAQNVSTPSQNAPTGDDGPGAS